MQIPKSNTFKSTKKGNKSADNTMNIDIETLDLMCRYIIGDPAFVKIQHVSLLNHVISGLSPKTYANDSEKLKRIRFIQLAIEARLKYNLSDLNLIWNHIVQHIGFSIDFIDMNHPLSKDETTYVESMIEDTAKFEFVYPRIDQFLNICTEIKTIDFATRGDRINQFEHLIDQTKNEFRKAELNDNINDMEFSLTNGKFEDSISEIYNILTSPSRRLVSGMQGLNSMIGGGFESGRVYMFLGITGAGKSILLLNLAVQMKKYNTKIVTKDPAKIPCIVYLTMENTVVETVNRLFSLVTDSRFDMSRYTKDQVIQKLKTEGQLLINDQNPINIIIKYKPNRSVDTTYLYTLYDNLNDEGYEMICLIQDHLLRIRSVDPNPEPRFELGNIVNEFKTFAAEKGIPVLSNFHLNREAMKTVEMASKRMSSIDVGQKLGKSNVSESIMILNNSDTAININPDEDENGTRYMTFNLVKQREKTDISYFAQPYAFANSIRLIEDINGPSMYKKSIHANPDAEKISNVKQASSNVFANMSNVNSTEIDNETSFISNDIYGSINSNIDELPAIESVETETKINKLPVVDPFIRGLPKEDPAESVKQQLGGLDDFKNLLSARNLEAKNLFSNDIKISQ